MVQMVTMSSNFTEVDFVFHSSDSNKINTKFGKINYTTDKNNIVTIISPNENSFTSFSMNQQFIKKQNNFSLLLSFINMSQLSYLKHET